MRLINHFILYMIAVVFAISIAAILKISWDRENEKLALYTDQIKNDTLTTHSFSCDSLIKVNAMQAQAISAANDSIIKLNQWQDTLQTRLFIANFRVESVKYYLNICIAKRYQAQYIKYYMLNSVNLPPNDVIAKWARENPHTVSKNDVFLKGWMKRAVQ